MKIILLVLVLVFAVVSFAERGTPVAPEQPIKVERLANHPEF